MLLLKPNNCVNIYNVHQSRTVLLQIAGILTKTTLFILAARNN